jgi:hypothetical protein
MSALVVERVDVWAATIRDKPGGLAVVLDELRKAGADLEFLVARRTAEDPGNGVVFLTPLRGDREVKAAATLGFNAMNSVESVRVQGENRPGIAAELTGRLAAAGLNLRGLSAAVIGTQFILYIGFDTAEDAAKAVDILTETQGD